MSLGVFGAIIAAISAIGAVAGAVATWWVAYAERGRIEISVVCALWTEITLNRRELETFVAESPDLDRLKAALEKEPDLVPLVTQGQRDVVYRTRLGDLRAVKPSTLELIVNFYGELETVRAQVDGISQAAFRTLSLTGKLQVFARLFSSAARAENAANLLLAKLSTEYPGLYDEHFRRRSQQRSGSELPDLSRLEKKISEAKLKHKL